MAKEDNKQNKPIDTAYISIELSQLEENFGQLDGLPSNPREITEAKMELLKKNIQQYPEMLKLRGLLVYPLDNGKYIIIGGNMRYKAMLELGFKNAPCIVIPKETTVEQMKAYTVIDNNGFGKWDWDALANEWDTQELEDWGIDLPITESEINMDEFFDENSDDGDKEKGEKLTVTIPDDFKEQKSEIKARIEEVLCNDFQGIKVK